MEIIQDIQNAYLPEFIIFIFIIINIVCTAFIRKNAYKTAKIINVSALMFSALSMFFIKINPALSIFNGVYISNIYTMTLKITILISAFLIILASNNLIQEKKQKSFEFFAIFLSGILSSFSLISSNNFICAFVSLELLSISCYFLVSFRNAIKSKAASLKYLITGASSSAIFLLGVSYLYGLSGQLDFAEINSVFSLSGVNSFFVISCILIIISLMFKLGCVPFNNWVIDVYNGANYSVCLYLSLIPKIAAVGFISRLFVSVFSFSPIIQLITAAVALYTIFYAAIGAIKQENIKKIYAYSSIIHSGFLLLGITILNVYAISSVIFYIFTYVFMNIGIWTASIIFTTEYQTDDINDYKGLFYKRPYFALALSVCLVSLAGLPVTGGFLSKLYLFSALSGADFIFFIMIFPALIAALTAMFVYFKLIKLIFEQPKDIVAVTGKSIMSKFILYLCSIITVLIGIFPNELIKLAQIISFHI